MYMFCQFGGQRKSYPVCNDFELFFREMSSRQVWWWAFQAYLVCDILLLLITFHTHSSFVGWALMAWNIPSVFLGAIWQSLNQKYIKNFEVFHFLFSFPPLFNKPKNENKRQVFHSHIIRDSCHSDGSIYGQDVKRDISNIWQKHVIHFQRLQFLQMSIRL